MIHLHARAGEVTSALILTRVRGRMSSHAPQLSKLAAAHVHANESCPPLPLRNGSGSRGCLVSRAFPVGFTTAQVLTPMNLPPGVAQRSTPPKHYALAAAQGLDT